jgi:hypothetical protein
VTGEGACGKPDRSETCLLLISNNSIFLHACFARHSMRKKMTTFCFYLFSHFDISELIEQKRARESPATDHTPAEVDQLNKTRKYMNLLKLDLLPNDIDDCEKIKIEKLEYKFFYFVESNCVDFFVSLQSELHTVDRNAFIISDWYSGPAALAKKEEIFD